MTAHYVYRCLDGDGRLLYVGCAQDVAKRLRQHARHAFWWPQVRNMTTDGYPDRNAARRAEALAIREESPRFNVKGRWATRATWTAEQWADYARALDALPTTTAWRESHKATVRAVRP